MTKNFRSATIDGRPILAFPYHHVVDRAPIQLTLKIKILIFPSSSSSQTSRCCCCFCLRRQLRRSSITLLKAINLLSNCCFTSILLLSCSSPKVAGRFDRGRSSSSYAGPDRTQRNPKNSLVFLDKDGSRERDHEERE